MKQPAALLFQGAVFYARKLSPHFGLHESKVQVPSANATYNCRLCLLSVKKGLLARPK